MRRGHDPFLKQLYRAGARDAVTLFFPHLAARIDWNQIQWVEKEVPILSPSPRSVIADLVGLTRDTEGRYLEVLIHPEIQMQPEDDMGWRVLQYNAGLTLQQANPNARVLTFVFYHYRGTGGIQRQRHWLDFYEEESLLGVTYWSAGLGDLDVERYAESDNPMAWALAAWMRQRRRGRPALRVGLFDKILRRVQDQYYRWLLLDAVRTYFKLNRAEQVEEQQLLKSRTYGEVGEMLQTELGRLEEKARREGEQEGRVEGQREALQSAFLAVVQSRFHAVPENIERRVRRVHDLATLEELIRRAARATTLEEIEPSLGQ
jgi:hypothetical protein